MRYIAKIRRKAGERSKYDFAGVLSFLLPGALAAAPTGVQPARFREGDAAIVYASDTLAAREVGAKVLVLDRDASPGRTEALIPAVRRAVGDDVRMDGDESYLDIPAFLRRQAD